MKDSSRKAMYAKQAKPFKVGAFVRGINAKYGQITKIKSVHDDGVKFFEVAFTFGKKGNRSDHQIKVVPRSAVSSDQLKAIKEVKLEK